MDLTRLRQTYAEGKSYFDVSGWGWWGGFSRSSLYNEPYLSTTKSTYDIGPAQSVFHSNNGRVKIKRSSIKRIPGVFLPFRVSSIVYGNSRYNGVGDTEWRRYDGSYGLRVNGAYAPIPRQAQVAFPMDASKFPSRNTAVEQWCLQNCVSSASEPVHAFGVTLGELAETVKMLISPSRAIAKLCAKSGLLGGSFVKPRMGYRRIGDSVVMDVLLFKPDPRVPKRLRDRFGVKSKAHAGCYVVNQTSDFWLTWRFGVSPLLKEIGDIMALDWTYWDDPSLRLAKKRYVEGKYDSTYKDQAFSARYGDFWVSCDVKSHWEYSTQASLSYRVNRGYGLDEALNGYGLSLRHLPSVLWELTPLSFVIDRFVDVSTLIGSLTPDPSVNPVNNCVSRNLHAYVDIIPGRAMYSGVWLDVYKERVKRRPFRIFVNSYWRDVQIPISSWPQINPRLNSLSQYVDHATLLWQRIPKFK